MDVSSTFQSPLLSAESDLLNGESSSSGLLMEAIQDSVFKAIESMETIVTSSGQNEGNGGNHYSDNHGYNSMIKSETTAFSNELMMNTGVGGPDYPVVTQVTDPNLALHFLPPSDENGTESYSYEILTPVQIFWPEADVNDNIMATTYTETLPITEPTVTYYVYNGNNNAGGSGGNVVVGANQVLPQDTTYSNPQCTPVVQPVVAVAEAESTSGGDYVTATQCNNNTSNLSANINPPTNPALVSSSTESCLVKKEKKKEKVVPKVHKCEICDKSFNQAYRLRTHISTVHLGTKPFKCNLCSRAFARKSYLQQHGQVHAETKKFQCKLCHTAYARLADYKKHCRKSSHLEKQNGISSDGVSSSSSLVKLDDNNSSQSQELLSGSTSNDGSVESSCSDGNSNCKIEPDTKVKSEAQNSLGSACIATIKDVGEETFEKNMETADLPENPVRPNSGDDLEEINSMSIDHEGDLTLSGFSGDFPEFRLTSMDIDMVNLNEEESGSSDGDKSGNIMQFIQDSTSEVNQHKTSTGSYDETPDNMLESVGSTEDKLIKAEPVSPSEGATDLNSGIQVKSELTSPSPAGVESGASKIIYTNAINTTNVESEAANIFRKVENNFGSSVDVNAVIQIEMESKLVDHDLKISQQNSGIHEGMDVQQGQVDNRNSLCESGAETNL